MLGLLVILSLLGTIVDKVKKETACKYAEIEVNWATASPHSDDSGEQPYISAQVGTPAMFSEYN
jgi:hypothetical protein